MTIFEITPLIGCFEGAFLTRCIMVFACLNGVAAGFLFIFHNSSLCSRLRKKSVHIFTINSFPMSALGLCPSLASRSSPASQHPRYCLWASLFSLRRSLATIVGDVHHMYPILYPPIHGSIDIDRNSRMDCTEHKRESEHNRWYNLSSNSTCSARCIISVNVSQIINATPLHNMPIQGCSHLAPWLVSVIRLPTPYNAARQHSTECCIGWWTLCPALFLSCIPTLGINERFFENVTFHQYSIHPTHLLHASCRIAFFFFFIFHVHYR